MILLTSLHRNELVTLTFQNGKSVEAAFVTLIHDPKGARFKLRNGEFFSITSSEVNAGWVVITRA